MTKRLILIVFLALAALLLIIRALSPAKLDARSVALDAAGWHGTIYPTLNALLRANYTDFSDDLIDFGGDSRLQNALNPVYFNGDGVHLIEVGSAVLAEIATPVLAKYM